MSVGYGQSGMHNQFCITYVLITADKNLSSIALFPILLMFTSTIHLQHYSLTNFIEL